MVIVMMAKKTSLKKFIVLEGLMLTMVIMMMTMMVIMTMAMKTKISELFKAALDEIGTTSHLFRFLSPGKKGFLFGSKLELIAANLDFDDHIFLHRGNYETK